MLETEHVHEECLLERQGRDDCAGMGKDPCDDDEMGVEQHLRALGDYRGTVCLEMGCGTGRFTRLLAEGCKAVVAADISEVSLRACAERLGPDVPVVLIHADITHLKVAPGAFDSCFSTLVSNLPTRRHREAMYALAREAVHDGGCFVFSTHHYSLRRRWKGVPQAGRYPGSGIFRYLFDRREIVEEARPYFGQVSARPIVVELPFGLGRLGGLSNSLAKAAERLPVMNGLGELVLVSAERPMQQKAERQVPEVIPANGFQSIVGLLALMEYVEPLAMAVAIV